MFFLAVNSTYTTVECGLFSNARLIDHREMDHKQASKELMLSIAELFAQNDISFSAISFIACNQGPGPFTTLRVAIASANGLGFAMKLPLIGIDGLDCFMKEYPQSDYPITVALFNAFSGDVYYALKTETTFIKGTDNAEIFLQNIIKDYPDDKIRFLGSGTAFYKSLIERIAADQAYVPEPLPQACSLEYLGRTAYEHWQENPLGVEQLMPLYLKSAI